MKKRFVNTNLEIATEYKVMADLWRDIEKEFEITKSRNRKNVIYRYSAMVAMKKHGNLPLADIGSIFNKDHATVIHANKAHQANYDYDKRYLNVYLNIESLVKESLDHYELRTTDIPELNSTQQNYDGVVRVYRKYINQIEDDNANLKLKMKLMEKKYDAMVKQFNTIVERNQRLNELANRYKNLI